MDSERVVTPQPDAERGRETMNALIAAAEAELLRGHGGTPERLSWLAHGLLRRSPTTLWKILKAQDEHEVERWPELGTVLTALGQRLLEDRRTRETEELLESARGWHVRVDGAVDRRLAEEHARSGDTATAEARIRDLLKREPRDIEALRLLYKLVKAGGRGEDA